MSLVHRIGQHNYATGVETEPLLPANNNQRRNSHDFSDGDDPIVRKAPKAMNTAIWRGIRTGVIFLVFVGVAIIACVALARTFGPITTHGLTVTGPLDLSGVTSVIPQPWFVPTPQPVPNGNKRSMSSFVYLVPFSPPGPTSLILGLPGNTAHLKFSSFLTGHEGLTYYIYSNTSLQHTVSLSSSYDSGAGTCVGQPGATFDRAALYNTVKFDGSSGAFVVFKVVGCGGPVMVLATRGIDICTEDLATCVNPTIDDFTVGNAILGHATLTGQLTAPSAVIGNLTSTTFSANMGSIVSFASTTLSAVTGSISALTSTTLNAVSGTIGMFSSTTGMVNTLTSLTTIHTPLIHTMSGPIVSSHNFQFLDGAASTTLNMTLPADMSIYIGKRMKICSISSKADTVICGGGNVFFSGYSAVRFDAGQSPCCITFDGITSNKIDVVDSNCAEFCTNSTFLRCKFGTDLVPRVPVTVEQMRSNRVRFATESFAPFADAHRIQDSPDTDGDTGGEWQSSPGGEDVRIQQAIHAVGSLCTINNTLYMATVKHNLPGYYDKWTSISDTRVRNTELLSFISSATFAIFSNLNQTIERMSDTWGWSYALPFNSKYDSFDTQGGISLSYYVANKNAESVRSFAFVGTNFDTYIVDVTNPRMPEVRQRIHNNHRANGRSWSDQKVYDVTELTVVGDVTALYMGKIIEFTLGAIGRVLTVNGQVVRLKTLDILTTTHVPLRHAFTISSARKDAFLYLTYESPAAVQIVNLSGLMGGTDIANAATLVHEYHNATAPYSLVNNTFPIGGLHNLYVDDVQGRLYTCGGPSALVNGSFIFDIRNFPGSLKLIGNYVPVNSTIVPGRAREYIHDFVTMQYTHDEQVNILGVPSANATALRVIAVSSNENAYDLIDVTDATNTKTLHWLKLRQGGGYYHQAWFTSDKHFLVISDEAQPRLERYQARAPILKVHWVPGQGLRLIEVQALKSAWPANMHNHYAYSNRRTRPKWIDTITYEPNAYYAAQPFEDHIYVTAYAGGLNIYSVKYRQGYNHSSIIPFDEPFDAELIGEMSATKNSDEDYGGAWSSYLYGGEEFPASERVFGMNGNNAFRVGQLKHGMDSLQARDYYKDGKVVLLHAQCHPDGSRVSGCVTDTKSFFQEQHEDSERESSILSSGANSDIMAVSVVDLNGVAHSGLAVITQFDDLLDLALFKIFLSDGSPNSLFFAPPISPSIFSNFSGQTLYSFFKDEIVHVESPAIETDYVKQQFRFGLHMYPDTWDTAVTKSDRITNSRRSEIVTSSIPASRGDSGSALIDKNGHLAGILRDMDTYGNSFGFVDVRPFNFVPDFSQIVTKYTGFWGVFDARRNNITVDPLDKIGVLAINPRNGRAYQCLSLSASPYWYGSSQFSGDSLVPETQRLSALTSNPGSVAFKFTESGNRVYGSAVSNSIGGTINCNVCILPVSGNVNSLLYGEELAGSFAGGGPAIGFLGVAPGTVTINSTAYSQIYYTLINHGTSESFTASPYVNKNIHPPNAGNVMTAKESGTVITVAPTFVQLGIVCPNILGTYPPSHRTTVAPQSGFWFWAPREGTSTTTAFLSRAEKNLQYIGNITLPLSFFSLNAQNGYNTGLLGIRIDDRPDGSLAIYDTQTYFEDHHTSTNRFTNGQIIKSIAGVPINKNNYFSALVPLKVGTIVPVVVASATTGALSTKNRIIFHKGGEENLLNIV